MIALNLGCGRIRRDDMIGLDANRGGAVDVLCDGTRLPFKNGSVDRIAAHHFVEHIPDQERLFRELARVLKTGGELWIRVPYKLAGLYDPFHAHVYDRWSLYSFCVTDRLSLQRKAEFAMREFRINRRVLIERPWDVSYHVLKYLPRISRFFLRLIAATEDLDGRERSKLGIRDEIECFMIKISG